MEKRNIIFQCSIEMLQTRGLNREKIFNLRNLKTNYLNISITRVNLYLNRVALSVILKIQNHCYQ